MIDVDKIVISTSAPDAPATVATSGTALEPDLTYADPVRNIRQGAPWAAPGASREASYFAAVQKMAYDNPGITGVTLFAMTEGAIAATSARDAEPFNTEHARDVCTRCAAHAQSEPPPAGHVQTPGPAPPLNPFAGDYSVDDIFAPVEPADYLVEALDLACGGAVNLVAGYGFAGKTTSLQAMAISIAAGLSVWGAYAAKSGKVLHIDYEQGRRLTSAKYNRIARAMGVSKATLAGRLGRLHLPKAYLTTPGAEQHLIAACEGHALVIVDSLRATSGGIEENSSAMREPLDLLSRVSEATGACIIVIHHARKPAKDAEGGKRMSIRGSGAIYDACASILVLSGEKGGPIHVDHEKARTSGVPAPSFTLRIEDAAIDDDPRGGLRVTVSGAVAEDKLAECDRIVRDALTANGHRALNMTWLAESLGKRPATVRAVVDALVARGEAYREGNAIIYTPHAPAVPLPAAPALGAIPNYAPA